MAAGPWTFYNSAKKRLLDGTFDMDTNKFRMGLFTGASNASTLTLNSRTELTNEVASEFGYTTLGQELTGVTLGAGESASEVRWDADEVVWTASGGSIADVMYAVIWQSTGVADALLCFCQLATAQFTTTTGNTLTVSPSANGIFELN